MTVSCYLFYVLVDDAGQYNLYLSNVASNITSMAEGKHLFDDLIWRTVLKTFFLGIIAGLIQACNFFLAAQWRQRLCDRFQELLLRSPNGCVLYDMTQTNENISKVITNDVKQFTSNFAIVLFGCMFFKSIISMFALIVTVSIFIVRITNGDASGILTCFVAFIFCVLISLPIAHLYNWNLVTQVRFNIFRNICVLKTLPSITYAIFKYFLQKFIIFRTFRNEFACYMISCNFANVKMTVLSFS